MKRRRIPNKDKAFPMDRQKKHEEVMQIKKDLANFAKTTWGKKWIVSILKIGRPYRMRRGINYAKDEGRISNLLINKGEIFSLVQGTAPTPYRVRIHFKVIPEKDWNKIIAEISNNLLNLIDLLEGKLSSNINNAFRKYDYSLFPDISESLNATCSCPDKAIPCKHIAATILYISRVVDYDPLILLKLRGKDKSELLNSLNFNLNIKSDDIVKNNDEKGIDKKDSKQLFQIPSISFEEIFKKERISNDIENLEFNFRKPGNYVETLQNLGLPPNLEYPKEFSIVLEKIYKTITKRIFRESTKT